MSDTGWLRRMLAASIGLWLAAAAMAVPALAADDVLLRKALQRLAKDSYSETASAIDEIVASGAPQSAALIEALGDRRLTVADGHVFYTDAAGKSFDAATGAPVAPVPEGGAAVRTNNRLRGAALAAIGTLRLASPDPALRRAAAEAVFRSRDPEALNAVRAVLKQESVPEIARIFAEAEAAIVLAKTDLPASERQKAVAVLAKRGDQDAIAALRLASTDADAGLAQSATEAIAAIELHLKWITGFQNVWYGLSLGSVMLLAAIGLAITFGVMGVINMAHGEMVMLGAYTTFVVQEWFRAEAPGAIDWALPIAVPLAFGVAGLVGIAIERGIIRFLYGRPLETLLATWGVSLILQQSVRSIFGPSNREVSVPEFMAGAFDFLGLQITYGRLWIIVFTLIVFASLLLLLKATPLGLQMRAVTQNRRMAAAMGIRTGRVDALTFGLGSGIAGIAGVALSQIDNVSPNLGQSYIVDSFMVVVFGGVGNLWGTLVSAFTLGIASKFMEPMVGAVLAKILILVLLILFIQKRPRGLFALKGRAVEA